MVMEKGIMVMETETGMGMAMATAMATEVIDLPTFPTRYSAIE